MRYFQTKLDLTDPETTQKPPALWVTDGKSLGISLAPALRLFLTLGYVSTRLEECLVALMVREWHYIKDQHTIVTEWRA